MTTFADRLNAAMDEASLSAAELAERSGLTESAISLLRSAQREPSYRTLTRLSAVLPPLAEGLSENPSPFDSIEDAIADIRAGKMVVVLGRRGSRERGRSRHGGADGHARSDQLYAQGSGRPDLRAAPGPPPRRTPHSADGRRQHRGARDRVHGFGRSARSHDDRHLARTTAPQRSSSCWIRKRGHRIFCGPATRFRCARARAACWFAPDKPKHRSIWRGWRDSIRPALFAKSWRKTEPWSAWTVCEPMPTSMACG